MRNCVAFLRIHVTTRIHGVSNRDISYPIYVRPLEGSGIPQGIGIDFNLVQLITTNRFLIKQKINNDTHTLHIDFHLGNPNRENQQPV
jgi:hypothetical protein